MSESLAWEKWSSFSHNRYVEEAERYSKPGSVAQKKAFFEAHYKKLAAQKAAALLEQQNNAASQNNVTEKEDNDENNDSQKSSKYEVVVKEDRDDGKVLSHALDSNMEKCIVSESNKLEKCETQMEQGVVLRNSMMVELQKRLENADTFQEQSEKFCATPPIMTPILEKTVVLRNSLRDELRKEDENVDTLQIMTPILKVIMLIYFEEFFLLLVCLFLRYVTSRGTFECEVPILFYFDFSTFIFKFTILVPRLSKCVPFFQVYALRLIFYDLLSDILMWI